MLLPFGTSSGFTAPSGGANQVYATPNGSSGSAALRALATADLPNANAVGSAAFGAFGSNNSAVSAVSILNSAITINKGDCVVVFGQNSNATATSGATVWQCYDDGGNGYFNIGGFTTAGVGVVQCYVCLNAAHAATQIFVRCNATASAMEVVAATYSGVSKATLSNFTTNNPGAVTGGTISLTPTQANAIMVAGFFWYKAGSTISVVANAGNLRVTFPSASTVVANGAALVDSTQAGLGSETCSVTASAAPTGWVVIALELQHN